MNMDAGMLLSWTIYLPPAGPVMPRSNKKVLTAESG